MEIGASAKGGGAPIRTLLETISDGTFAKMSAAKPPRDRAWEATTRGDYQLALELYQRKAAKRSPKGRELEKLDAWFFLGRFEEARSALADAQRRKEELKAPQSFRTALAVVTWLCGKRKAAIETLMNECDAILSGKTKYLTNSFGADEGAYLFYFGASTRDDEVKKHACTYLEKASRKRFYIGSTWPPGLHDYLCNKLPDTEMQEIVLSRTSGPEYERVVVSHDDPERAEEVRLLLRSKDLMKLDFWRAIKMHAKDGKRTARKFYSKIAEAPKPIISKEWYLARAEIGRQSAPVANGE